jgi:hypothetical protein
MRSPIAASLLALSLLVTASAGQPTPVLAAPPPEPVANNIYVGSAVIDGLGADPCDEPDFSVNDFDMQITLSSAIQAVDHDGDVVVICEGSYIYSGDIDEHDGGAVGSHPTISIEAAEGAVIALDGDFAINHQLLDFIDTDVIVSGIVFQRGGDGSGGAISVVSTNGTHGLTVVDSAFYLNQATYGAAIFAENMDVSISGSVFGAARNDDDTPLIIEGVNSASFRGGAIYAIGSGLAHHVDIVVSDSEFIENDVLEYGGAIMVADQTRLTVTRSTFMGNEARTVGNSCGGAIYLLNEGGAQISGSSFVDNHAGYTGGAITSQTCHTYELQHLDATVVVQGSQFEDNSADCAGGAIESLGLVVRTSVFSRNEAGTCAGGAIAIKNTPSGSRVELISNVFTENALTGDACCEGGAVYVWYEGTGAGADPIIRGNTFRGNRASTSAGALTLRSVSNVSRVIRNVFWSNRAPRGGAISQRACVDVEERTPSRRATRQLLSNNRFRVNRADVRREADIYRNLEPCPVG